MHGIDIKEDELLAMGGGILDALLLNRTTGKSWQEYVSMGVIEITCGEAPFLASR